jgi:lipopolysaccharide/colanic/teichoic acid biosynthesis glycosyltransferase
MTREKRVLVGVLAAGDALALALSHGLAAAIGQQAAVGPGPGIISCALGVVVTQALFLPCDLYNPNNLLAGHREYAGVVKACTYSTMVLIVGGLLVGMSLSPGGIAVVWYFSTVIVGSWRFLMRRLAFRLRLRGLFVERLLIVGADEHGTAIARQLQAPEEYGIQVVGFLDDYRPVGAPVLDGLRVLGDPRQALEIAHRRGASTILVVPHAISWESNRLVLELANGQNGVRVQLAPGLDQVLAASAHPTDQGFVPLVNLEQLRIKGLDATLKTVLDRCVSLILLVVVTPLLALCWLAAKIDGRGPVLARHRVLGRGDRAFSLLMLSDCVGPEPDSWLARRAWRLRRTIAASRWAKIPNVLNVLAGRMSLVGPRATPERNGSSPHPWPRNLLLVRPGLTGPTVEHQHREDVEAQAVKDVAYVRNYSLWLDLRLLFASAKRMMRREQGLPPAYEMTFRREAAAAAPAARESGQSSMLEAKP